jgi:hypothetical protein
MTERDDAVSRRYRELPAEEPPRALDEAILAASRRAHAATRRPAEARPAPLVAPAGRQRWYVPLAAAAVIVLAVGLTLRVQLENPADNNVARVEEMPAKALKDQARIVEEDASRRKLEGEAREKARQDVLTAKEPARERSQSGPAPFPAEQGARAAAVATAPAAPAPQADTRMAESMMQRAPAASAPEAPVVAAAAPPPPPAARPAPAPLASEMRAPGRSDDALGRDRAERQVASASAGATAKRLQEADETPEKALERIAELRKAGKHDEADKALAEFRKRLPDYKIPEATRERVERPLAR